MTNNGKGELSGENMNRRIASAIRLLAMAGIALGLIAALYTGSVHASQASAQVAGGYTGLTRGM